MTTNNTHNAYNNAFQLNDKYYSIESLYVFAKHSLLNGTKNEIQLGEFILDWIDESDEMTLKTSGTTSKPTTIKVSKIAFINSAKATGDFFNLKVGDSALCSLPFSYIAAKMMFVRAWVLGLKLDIVEPSSNPLEHISKHYDFSAMVPLQVQNSFLKINQIRTLLVGGAPVSIALAAQLKGHNSTVFETFGMTETVSHIAARNLTKGEKFFNVLPGVKISVNNNDCLVVEAPKLTSKVLQTNDVVSLVSSHSFLWLGRYDNVINSGGLKIHPELLENALQHQIKKRFFITSIPDETLGQKVVLIVEGKPEKLRLDFCGLDSKIKPKKIYYLDKFCETSSGKIQRQKTLNCLNLNHP